MIVQTLERYDDNMIRADDEEHNYRLTDAVHIIISLVRKKTSNEHIQTSLAMSTPTIRCRTVVMDFSRLDISPLYISPACFRGLGHCPLACNATQNT